MAGCTDHPPFLCAISLGRFPVEIQITRRNWNLVVALLQRFAEKQMIRKVEQGGKILAELIVPPFAIVNADFVARAKKFEDHFRREIGLLRPGRIRPDIAERIGREQAQGATSALSS